MENWSASIFCCAKNFVTLRRLQRIQLKGYNLFSLQYRSVWIHFVKYAALMDLMWKGFSIWRGARSLHEMRRWWPVTTINLIQWYNIMRCVRRTIFSIYLWRRDLGICNFASSLVVFADHVENTFVFSIWLKAFGKKLKTVHFSCTL